MADNMFDKYRENAGTPPPGSSARSTNPFIQYAARPQPSAAAPSFPVAKRPERSWGQVAGDSALGVASGAANIIGGVVEMKASTRPDNLARQGLRVLDRLGVAGMNDLAAKIPRTPSEAMLGHAAGTENAAVSAGVKAASDWIGSKQSDALKNEKQELAQTEGFFGSAKKVLTSPALLGNFVAEQVPNLVTMGGGTRLAAARAGQRALAGAVAKGLGEEAASAAASAAGRKAAIATATGLTTLMETGAAGQQTYQQAIDQPQAVWDANPEYRRMIAAGTADSTAKETIARGASMQAQAITAPIAAAAGRFAAPFEADIFTRGLVRKPLAVLQGAARETIEETIQEGGSQFSSNIGQQQVDPNQATWAGVPEAAGTGAALGAVMGGGMATGGVITSHQSRIAPRPQPPAMPPPELPPQQLALPPSNGEPAYGVNIVTPGGTVLTPEQRGLDPRVIGEPSAPVPNPNAVPGVRAGSDSFNQQALVASRPKATVPFPNAAPGSLSEAANLTAEARTPNAGQASVGDPSQEPSDPLSQSAAPMAPTIAPPWVDTETGEQTRAPTSSDIEQLLHANFEYQARNGGGISTAAALTAMREQYGLGRSVVGPALSKVKAERKRGVTSAVNPNTGALADNEANLRQQVQAAAAERKARVALATGINALPLDEATVAPVVDGVAEVGAGQTSAFNLDDSPSIPVRRKEWDEATGRVREATGEGRIIDYGGRKMLLRNINGVMVPFYLSTGAGGKADVAAGKWYPFFGIGADGWINKLGSKEINNFYGSAELKKVAEQLDREIGDVREAAHEKAGVTGPHVDFINQSMLSPTENERSDTRKKVDATIADILGKVDAGTSAPAAVASRGTDVAKVAESAGSGATIASGRELDRVAVGATDGWSNQNAQAARDNADRHGITSEIEQLFANGGTARQVQAVLGDRLSFMPVEERGSFVVQVRATLGIPSRSTAEGKAEFDQWKSTRDARFAPRATGEGLGGDGVPIAAALAADSEVSGKAAVAPIAAPGPVEPAVDLAGAAAEAATSPTNELPQPTEAQKEAGNYKKGHRRINGHDISIENPAGSKRSPDWPALKNHYGYIKGTVGKDKDHVDVFMTDQAEDPALPVFVVDQVNKDGSFDEHKVVMGTATEAEARSTYLDNYEKGWTGLGGIKQMTQDEFKAWVRDPKKTTRRVTRSPRTTAAPVEAAVAAPAPAPAPAPKAATTYTPRVRKIGGSPEYDRNDVGTLGAYFQPGRVVKGYAGQLDKVLEFNPSVDKHGRWSVKVQRVDKDGEFVPGEDARWHSTSPAPRDLAEVLGKPEMKPRRAAAAKPVADAQEPKARKSRAADVALAYGGPAFKVAAEEAKADSRGTGSVGVDRVSAAATTAEPVAEAVAKPKADGAAIEDFGETLHGARKHYAAAYAERMRQAYELDLATTPLSKSWPEPDYQKLLDSGAEPFSVAWVRAARDEIPNRPSAAWKLKGWAGQVEVLRDAAARLLDGSVDATKLRELTAQHPGVAAKLQGRMDLYQAVGHDKSLKGITLRSGEYTVYGGERYNPPRTVYTVESRSAGKSWPKTLAEGDTKEAAIEAFKALQAAPSAAASEGKAPTRFDIISLRSSVAGSESVPRFAVAKKIGREYVELESFDSIKEARTYRAEHQQDLEKKLEQLKDIPAERRDANEPRVGIDHRAGADVTPAQFSEAFGFRGVQFGNYVEDGRRQRDLNDAYDGLLDLAGVLGIEPRALSLNGTLGLAFGARGRGGKRAAAAHFERGTVVINLTKANGAGSLAHEWFHGLDNYFARMRGDSQGMVTDNPRAKGRDGAQGIRPEMAGAFDALRRAIDASGMADRSAELDRVRSTPYWTTPPEMAARAFESYVIDKLADQGQANDYLANVVAEEAFEGMRALATGKPGKRSYPYPSADEAPALRAAFDEFFQTIESERMPDGSVRLFSLPADPVDSPAFKRWFAGSQVVGANGRPQTVFHGTGEQFYTFSKHRSGEATGHATAPLGHFFTTDRNLAKRYAENASDGVPADERVIDAHLRVENPYVMPLEEAQSLDTPEASAAFQAYLQRQGFDGIQIPEAKTWIAFRPEQIKSASENRGSFELTNPDIRFSRGDSGPGLTFDRALQLKNELTAKWGDNAPNVVVVRSAEDFPSSAKADPAYRRAEGLYNGSPTIWINAGAITNEARFGQVLAHEAIGHYGVESVVGKAEWGQIVDAIDRLASTGSGSAALQSVLDSVAKRYGTVDRETFAKEAIAVMAERGIRNSFTSRVVASVRRFLRRLMPSLQWSESDVRDLLSQADGFLRVGRNAGERQSTVQAYAFSQSDTGAALRPDPEEATAYRAEFDKTVNSLRTVVPPIPVGRTPQVLRTLGAPDLPITVTRDVVRKASNGVKHDVSREVLRQLPELLADPQAVFDSKAEAGGLAVLLNAKDASGRPVMVALHLQQQQNRMVINRVASAYGRPEVQYQAWTREGLLRYVADAKNPDLVRLVGLQLPVSGSPDQGSSGRKVLARADLVNEAPDQVRPAQQDPAAFDPERRLFSLPASDALDDIDAIQKGLQGEGLLARAKQLLAGMTPKKLKDAKRPTWLGALATRHLTELGADYFQNINHYSDYLAKMQADRNQLQGEAEVVAEAARKWVGKNKAEAQQLFDLMHDATVDGVDPSKAYQPLMFKMPGQSGQFQVTKKNIKHAIAVKKQQMKERSGDSKVNMINEIKALEAMGYAEPRRQKQYAPLVDRWNQLSPEAQGIYKQFRDAYRQRSDAMEEALAQRIEDLSGDGVSEAQRRKLVQRMREQFESARLQGVYFPLQRFGQHYVSAEKDDTNTFMMFQTLNELEQAVNDLKAKGWTITAHGKKGDKVLAKDAPSGTFVADVIQQLRQSHVSDKVQDEIYQLYLEALPELSMRKHSIHRKGIPGFDPDAVRAFAYNMHHGSHQLARLRYSHKLQGVVDLIQKQQDEARKEDGADVRRIVAGDTIIEELKRRHDWIMNPTDSALTNMVSSFGFVYYLGATPAAALVNLSQTALVSYPFLAARHGPVKAMNYLLAASRDAVRTMGNIQKTLTDPDEVKAYQALQASGAIDKTQAHNLAGIAEGGMTGYNPAWSKAMEIIGWGFHKTEVVNREATGMAAFRLAKDGGAGFDEAVKFAQDTIFDTHFDYSNANRARFMQSGTAKVLLMFRQYSLNMSWALGRMVWQATKGQSPEVRQIARRNLAGVMGMSALFSGALGLPMMGVAMGTLNALQSAFGDDDEPWDAETEFRAFLAEALGPSGAEVLLRGPVNKLTGANIAGRVGLDSLWIRDADRELEGRGLFNHLLEQAAGPMGGVLKNVLVGTQQVGEGHTMRGVETMLPKGLKDMIKAGRYATQGVNTLRGDPVLEDVSPWQVLLQGAGFSPAEVAERYERNRALKNYEEHITKRRQSLMNAYAMAIRNGDAADRVAVMEKVRAFNKANPELAISSDSIRASLKSRARYSAKAEAGIVINPKLAARLQERVGPAE
ncbi:PLxRFG domain-containing protein [Stenotrophomonas sp. PS02298]|uniref:PLxRFG domain-containing protein n=1 Tax=Stenotrophomonas sp. PS02298 TaxID=2991424 RepID=UPI00249AE111|nr:PLxRFG domain-containing protein [Stenotrophomonas sp. PS02298]